MLTVTNLCTVLLLVAIAAAKQKDHSSTVKQDQEGAADHVTSILVHHGPSGPRHVILSDEHQVSSTGGESFTSRAADSFHQPAVNYPPRVEDVEFHHTVPPPLPRVTYGPARPVALRVRRPLQQPAQLYHHRFAGRPAGKIPHLKTAKEDKGLSEAIYKYSMYIKHGKDQDVGSEVENSYTNRDTEKPDYSYRSGTRGSYVEKPQQEGLSAYRNGFRDEEEIKYRDSIGDLDENNYDNKKEYQSEKRSRPLPYSKLYFTKQHIYVPNNVNDKKPLYSPVKNFNSYNSYDDEPYHDKPSGFDDNNGGKVVPLLARFYKQPLPIIHTQLPADNKGVYIQLYHPQRSNYDREELSNNFYEQYPQDRASIKSNYHTSDSEWTPINAPDGAVPAKSYDIPAPDLSLGKVSSGKVYRRDSSDGTVVVGKSKQTMTTSHHIQGNSEGVVSAVVRVKQ